jgi:hypothetical protein
VLEYRSEAGGVKDDDSAGAINKMSNPVMQHDEEEGDEEQASD